MDVVQLNEQGLKHRKWICFMNLKLNIFKNKLDISKLKKGAQSSNYLSNDLEPKSDLLEDLKDQKLLTSEKNIPQFMSLSKLEFDKFDVRAGLIKDPTAKGGIRYQIIEPMLSERDKKALDIIKKLLMTELSVSMGEIKSQ
jgi:flagellar protein FlaI